MEKEKELSEDELHRGQDQVQKLTDKYVEECDKVLAAKEDEIMEI
jgi:ribosome recycling factor